MSRFKVGKIMMNGASTALKSGELIYIRSLLSNKDGFNQNAIVGTMDGSRDVKTGLGNLLDVTFFLHPKLGMVYIATHSYQTIVSSGSYGSSTIPVFTVFKNTEKGVVYEYERQSVYIRDLLYIGELDDLDKVDKYDPINKRT